MNDSTRAASSPELDAATLAAQIAEQQKVAAEAKKAAAQAEADAAAIAAKAANDLAKGKADADKARADADKAKVDIEKSKADADKSKADADKAAIETVKAGLPAAPDPSKYKIDKPTAPNLAATVGRLTYDQAVLLAASMSADINTKAAGKTLLPDDAKVRTLMAMGTATKEALLTAKTGLDGQVNAVKDKINQNPATAFAPGVALAIGALAENILSYAYILRTQYGFTTASVSSNAEAALTALVLQKAIAGGITVIDADGALPQNPSDISNQLGSLRNSIKTARDTVLAAGSESKKRRDAAPVGADDAAKAANRAANIKFADELDRLADTLGKTIDEAQKLAAALFVVDAQGNIPFDLAQRGETLAATLSGKSIATLTLKVITSDADTVATDGIFRGFKVYAGNTTVARWKLVDSKGVVIGAGASMKNSEMERIKLKGDD